MAQFQVSNQLVAIARFNPGIQLTDNSVKKINAGQIVLVGRGSTTPSSPTKGCVEWLFYDRSGDDLTRVKIDGNWYSPDNLKDFRDVIQAASLAGKCINFCIDQTDNTMFMLNVYPQCCCECEEVRD